MLDWENVGAWDASVDITYVYDQVPLHLLTAKLFNFQIIGVKSTHKLVTGFYGLTIIRIGFQKMDNLLAFLARLKKYLYLSMTFSL